MDRLPRYDSRTTKREALDLIWGAIPTAGPICPRCQYLAAFAIVDERWQVRAADYFQAENLVWDYRDDPPKKHTH